MDTFSGKLRLFMQHTGIKNATLARALSVDPALVSFWLSGKRKIARDNPMLEQIAAYIIRQCSSEVGTRWLCGAMRIPLINPKTDYERLLRNVADWLLFEEITAPSEQAGFAEIFAPGRVYKPYVGSAGLGEALSQLDEILRLVPEPQLRVYISSEQCSLLFEPQISALWRGLSEMTAPRPVEVFFEQWNDDDRVSAFLSGLTPLLMEGRISLHVIRSAEQCFCHNLTVFAPGVAALMVVEPIAALGNSVTMITEDRGFVTAMGEVFGRLERISHAMLTILDPEKRQLGGCYRAFYGAERGVDIMSDGLPILFLPPDAFARLLKVRRVPIEQRRYRSAQYTSDHENWLGMLSRTKRRELICIDHLDDLVQGKRVALFGQPFLQNATPDAQTAESLLTGMLRAVEECGGYELRLTKTRMLPGQALLIQEDRQALLQSWQTRQESAIHTESWLLTRRLRGLFEEAWDSPDILVRDRGHVAEALRYRLGKL